MQKSLFLSGVIAISFLLSSNICADERPNLMSGRRGAGTITPAVAKTLLAWTGFNWAAHRYTGRAVVCPSKTIYKRHKKDPVAPKKQKFSGKRGRLDRTQARLMQPRGKGRK